jgi:cytochrome c553
MECAVRWLDRLETKFGRFAVPGLIRIVAAFNALVFILHQLNPRYLDALVLDPARVLHGEVWRLATYIFIPQFGSAILGDWLSVVLYLWFLIFVGDGLEQAWGAFRLNLFFLLGMIGTTTAAMFFDGNFSSAMLTASLFFAFARFYGDTVIYLFFILPVKVRWLAWVQGALLLLAFLMGGWSLRCALIVAMGNYLLFFGPEIFAEARLRGTTVRRRAKFESEARSHEAALHICAVCHCTEITSPEKEFRVSRDGNEYCTEHLPPRNNS